MDLLCLAVLELVELLIQRGLASQVVQKGFRLKEIKYVKTSHIVIRLLCHLVVFLAMALLRLAKLELLELEIESGRTSQEMQR
jgi:hypothetical protein